jgi:hypothetical protein
MSPSASTSGESALDTSRAESYLPPPLYEACLGFRERKGQHTLTDNAIASDLRVFALAIAYLEERIRD